MESGADGNQPVQNLLWDGRAECAEKIDSHSMEESPAGRESDWIKEESLRNSERPAERLEAWFSAAVSTEIGGVLMCICASNSDRQSFRVVSSLISLDFSGRINR